ncbi:adenylosuccinate lyase [Spiroplasma endosymbiont of Amphibalanus improvisus]|uniref:adenylosuccinate lyase n=1 Tax=Spiroplasma endosymbiont of Amphibalanus improvisus TaxID=3066327 RepID=UPI00313CA5D0
MINRYIISEIENIWSEENKLQTWLNIEKLVCGGWNKIGIISDSDFQKIKNSKIDLNLKKFLEIEEETKHDVVAFVKLVSNQLGVERKWFHYGLTSSDIVDTAQNYLIKKSNDLVLQKIVELQKILKVKAIENKDTIIFGRTHGIFGEPTSLGLKFLLWYQEFDRHIERLKFAKKEIEIVNISGSMGNFAHVDLEVENYVANELNFSIDKINTQVTQRDIHANLLSCFANLGSTFLKISTEIRHFQRSEVRELQEGFSKNQKGSSSMPHKKNPISSENISGLSRLLISNANIGYENNVLWHERDISHSSNERIIFPDSYHLLIHILNKMINIFNNININYENIEKNLISSKNIYYSQLIMNYILKNTRKSRDEVYDFIQKCTFESLRENKDFINVLIDNDIYNFISQQEFKKLINIKHFLKNVNKIFQRVLNE